MSQSKKLQARKNKGRRPGQKKFSGPQKPKVSVPFTEAIVTISRLGLQGDGLAQYADVQLFVPGVLPGEEVRVRPTQMAGGPDSWRTEVLGVISPSSDRQRPACQHADLCGGCATQSLSEAAYRTWKRAGVQQVLARASNANDILSKEGDPYWSPQYSRRRVRWAAVCRADGVILGFHGAHSHHVVAVPGCVVVVPTLDALRQRLSTLLQEVMSPGDQWDIQATELGISVISDVASAVDLVIWADRDLEMKDRLWVGEILQNLGIARVAWAASNGSEPEVLVDAGQAVVTFGTSDHPVTVTPPPGAFLQADQGAEAFMVACVQRWIGAVSNVGDLYCGSGTFSFALSSKTHVWAIEGQTAAITALQRAAHTNKRTIATEVRDLKRRPPVSTELQGLDAVIVDPPRAGAKETSEALAQHGPKAVVMVSCNPATLARDLKILLDGGYEVQEWHFVDQFRWTAHAEVIAYLTRTSSSD